MVALFVGKGTDAQLKTINNIGTFTAFVKDESYPRVTDPRMIYNPSMLAKCIYGWMFKQIEFQIYDIMRFPEFVKHIAVRDRPAYIKRMLTGYLLFMETDFTSMESSITGKWMVNIEFKVQDYIFSQCSECIRNLIKQVQNLLMCHVKILFQFFVAIVEEKRKSGTPDTAVMNALTNLIILMYIFAKCAIPFAMVGEGDDGAAAADRVPDVTIALRLGFKLEFDVRHSLGELSFCGIQFHEDADQAIREPFKSICNMSSISKQYFQGNHKTKIALVRLKALSYAFEYPACPMVTAYAHAILDKTKGIHQSTLSKLLERMHICDYDKKRYLDAFKSLEMPHEKINPMTRMLFEEIYGVSYDNQVLFEADPLGCTARSLFLDSVPSSYHSYSQRHSYDSYHVEFRQEIVKYGLWRKSGDLRSLELVEPHTSFKLPNIKGRPKPEKAYRPDAQVILDFISSPHAFVAAIAA